MLNSTIPVVAPSAASVPIALALYNSVSNVVRGPCPVPGSAHCSLSHKRQEGPTRPASTDAQGGLVGPWLIGDFVSRTGRVHDAFAMLGVSALLVLVRVGSVFAKDSVAP